MTDNEIIRCLRHCRAGDCENCKALNVCDATFSFHKEALDLINRQNAKIERLEKIRAKQANIIGEERGQKYELINKLGKANTEIERLLQKLQQSQSEAIKEFAKELKNCFAISGDYLDIINIIDNLVKEMTEE